MATTNTSKSWVCPVCSKEHKTAQNLANHIGGMIFAYRGPHLEWAEAHVPHLDLVKAYGPFGIGSQLIGAVIASVEPVRQPVFQVAAPTDRFSALSAGYYVIAKTEVSLHDFIIAQLRNFHGTEEKSWWSKGIPWPIRKKCGERQNAERVSSQKEEECYLDILDLKDIIRANWTVFEPVLREIPAFPGRDQFLQMFETLNVKRRMIMHPLRGDTWGQDDQHYVVRFQQIVDAMVGNSKTSGEREE